MAQETKKYDEDYLNGLIAKAKKSWEGVDVDSYMSNLRDNDMTSIEERAHSFACLNDKPSSFFSDLEKGYLAGATEQKAIDEEVRLKKCDDMTQAEYNRETAFADWYHKNRKGTPTYSDAIEWARKDLLNKVCEYLDTYLMEIGYPDDWLRDSPNIESGKERFRKAMEEQICHKKLKNMMRTISMP